MSFDPNIPLIQDDSVPEDFDSSQKEWKSTNTKIYNVVLIGDTGTGKTTFLRMLKNINYRSPINVQNTADTKTTETHDVTVFVGEELVTIRVIDTPGFSEISDDKTKSDEVIASLIKNTIQNNMTEIHLVVLFSPGGRMTVPQIETFDKIQQSLTLSFYNNMCLMITNSELLSFKLEAELENSLMKAPQIKRIHKKCKAGVFFTGACSSIKSDEIHKQFLKQQIYRQHKWLRKLMSVKPKSLIINQADSKTDDSLFKSSMSFESDLRTLIEYRHSSLISYNKCVSALNQIETIIKRYKGAENEEYNKKKEELMKMGDIIKSNTDDEYVEDLKILLEAVISKSEGLVGKVKDYGSLIDTLGAYKSALDELCDDIEEELSS